ncbi:transglutaminase TgpA family protein [Subtercola boreus]|uniref:Transglutaminase-like domain-containing protein n=1 Tax=Subtercola boreus TaxID=120213 RepID=A0A3E0WAL1_9MICO|nr:DUF3488 and transglutaminase-like domain-containing protein [Subtercola boreus]RFA19783.1 hypothetical protein B7R24_11295 [Subtercola boreus]RFA19808.1 hypothetical protein B7R23_11275 [Subtercola boreus]RFA26203.1 hypothetical protein B7R25_11395 [Subtercola boreus]
MSGTRTPPRRSPRPGGASGAPGTGRSGTGGRSSGAAERYDDYGAVLGSDIGGLFGGGGGESGGGGGSGGAGSSGRGSTGSPYMLPDGSLAASYDQPNATATHRARQAALSPLIFLLIALPVGGLAPLLAGADWWWGTCLLVALVLGVAAVIRLFPVPAWVPPLGALIAWAVSITLVFAPAEALFGFLPTFDTLRTIRSLLGDAGESIAVQSVPADPVVPIVLLLCLTVGLLAVLADSLVFGLRMPALAGLVPAAILTVPYSVRQQDFDIVLFIAMAATYVLLLWGAARLGIALRLKESASIRSGRNAGRALLSGALAIALACFLPGVTPGLTPGSFRAPQTAQLPSVYSSGVDPSIQLSQDLRRTNPVLSLTYSTTSESGLYLKLVNLSDFTEGPWQPESLTEAFPLGNGFGTPDGLAADVATQPVASSMTVTGLRSDWLPVPYPATNVSGLNGDWTISPRSLTVTSVNTNTSGQNYGVTSLAVQPTAAQLAAAGTTVPDALQSFVELPRDIAPVIRNTARLVTEGETSTYDKAVALQSYFTSGAFQYSVTAPVEGHYDGGNFAAVATFLSAKSGYCIHFASAMAVMARTLGIPSRVAIGYHPGGAGTRSEDGLTTFQVYSDQLHAWPELWFDGIGWLAFEPTPGLGLTPPDYSLPNYTGAATTDPIRDSAGSTAAPTTPRAAPELDPGAVPVSDPQVQAAQQGRAWLVALGITILVVLLALAPAAWRRRRRRRRFGAMQTAEVPASIGWQEITDTARDYRFELAAGETARGFATRLGALYHMPGDEIEELLRAVERERFAPPGRAAAVTPDERERLLRDVQSIIRALSAQASTADDRRALFLPLSLLGGGPSGGGPSGAGPSGGRAGRGGGGTRGRLRFNRPTR